MYSSYVTKETKYWMRLSILQVICVDQLIDLTLDVCLRNAKQSDNPCIIYIVTDPVATTAETLN